MRLKRTKLRGNAFLITLISVVLLGTLTLVVARQISGSDAVGISNEKAELYANRVIAHAEEMKQVLQQMQSLNIDPASIDFDPPSSGTFNSGNTAVKVFHPAGGGLKQPALFPQEFYKNSNYDGLSATQRQWQYQNVTNVQWTPTSATDIIYSIWGMSDAICAAINNKITGSTAIPIVNTTFTGLLSYNSSGTNYNFTTSTCGVCNSPPITTYPMLCVQKSSDSKNGFYSVVLAR